MTTCRPAITNSNSDEADVERDGRPEDVWWRNVNTIPDLRADANKGCRARWNSSRPFPLPNECHQCLEGKEGLFISKRVPGARERGHERHSNSIRRR